MAAIPGAALWLGLAGLAPFYACAVLTAAPQIVSDAAHPWAGQAGLVGFSVYAAAILSFLGGVRWGLALPQDPPRTAALVYGVAPSIAGWLTALAAILSGPEQRLGIGLGSAFAVLFLGQYLWDRTAQRDAAPAWYPRLRLVLTLGVLGACLIVAAGQALRRV